MARHEVVKPFIFIFLVLKISYFKRHDCILVHHWCRIGFRYDAEGKIKISFEESGVKQIFLLLNLVVLGMIGEVTFGWFQYISVFF